jgi:hypothetical protein
MLLLDQIIEAGTANVPPPLTSVLRQCIVLANELKTPLLRTWAEQELNGYATPQDVPDYRIVPAGSYGTFQGTFGTGYNGRPIPAALLEPDHRPVAEVVHLTQPVSAYESLGDLQGALTYPWPANMIAYYQDRLLRDCILLTAWQSVPKTAIAGVLDTIRTRVLTMAIDIKNGFEELGADIGHVKKDSPEAEKVEQTVINNIYNGAVNIAAGDQVINTQNISIEKWEDLRKVLKSDGISDGDLAELSRAIEKDGKKFGSGVKGWISRNAGKVFDQGIQVTASVGTTILTATIKKHLGLT